MNSAKRLGVIGGLGFALFAANQPATAVPGAEGATRHDYAATAQQRQGRMQQRFERLKADLKLSSQQEPQWQAFAQAAQQQMSAARAARAQVPPSLTAPERMGQRIAYAEQRLAGLQQMQAALNDLYAVLTPEQRVIMDQRAARHYRGGLGDRMGQGPG